MKLPPLVPATLIRRYKRFLADVTLADGCEATVHVPNSGAMMGLKAAGLPLWLADRRDAVAAGTAKLPYRLELVGLETGLVGVNTANPNPIVAEAIHAGAIAPVAGYPILRREVKYGRNSRIDILLQDPDGPRPDCYVEVKNVHLRRADGPYPTAAEFPDSVTTRGAKHLEELGDQVAFGRRAVMMYLIQRMDCDRFTLAADIDPAYAAALDRAVARGVEVLAYACHITTTEITVSRPLPVIPVTATRTPTRP